MVNRLVRAAGLASVVFGLITVEELGTRTDPPVAAIVATVLLSVVAHGATAAPLAARFGPRLASIEASRDRAASLPSARG